ncbi:MAG: hypothetical protein GX654_13270 [Desulfatiglans sp.]|jgi:predicted peptidase|nr:hypothetical protein [Desulfatiglans sp.]
MPKFPITIKPDTRVEQRKYHFTDKNEDLGYVLFISSKVSKDKKNPLIIALHGLGGTYKRAIICQYVGVDLCAP